MAVFILDASGIVKRYLTEISNAWVQRLTDPAAAHEAFLTRITRLERFANGLSRPTPISADHDLNAAAIAEGLQVDDPMAHP